MLIEAFISDEAFERVSDDTDKKYDKVRRDNIMVKSGASFTRQSWRILDETN